MAPRNHELRSPERLRAHYVIERELSDRLRHARREERRGLYTAVYDELFRRVPDHPQLTRKADAAAQAVDIAEQMRLLGPYLSAETTYLEIGAGDYALSLHVAARVRRVIALDVSESITADTPRPPNFSIVISDGTSVPVPQGSIDLAYSNQVMEHLHPEDARTQLGNILAALRAGGRYVCITPSRLSGPHDISRYFDERATGFHLREYSTGERAESFRAAGFSRVRAVVGARGRLAAIPVGPVAAVERVLDLLPPLARRKLATGPALRWLLGVRLVAIR